MKQVNTFIIAILILVFSACASTNSNVPTQEQFGDPGKTEPLIAIKIYSPDEPNAPIPDEAPSTPPPSLTQQRTAALSDTTIFTHLEMDPSFYNNGKNASAYICEEIAKAKAAYTIKQTGTEKLKFVVERDGSLSNPVILETSSESLTKHSLAILNKMPKWQPGSSNGWERRAYVTLDFNW